MPQDSRSTEVERQAEIQPGTYLLNGRGEIQLDEVDAFQYDLKVSGGVEQYWDREQFTSSAAYYLDQKHGSPVAQVGKMSVLSKTDLSRSVRVWQRNVTPINRQSVTLSASQPEDREKIKSFVQSCFKRAVPTEKYSFRFLNKIVRDEPEFTTGSEGFSAHPKHDVKIQVTADGGVLIHVDSGFSIRSNSTLDEIYSEQIIRTESGSPMIRNGTARRGKEPFEDGVIIGTPIISQTRGRPLMRCTKALPMKSGDSGLLKRIRVS